MLEQVFGPRRRAALKDQARFDEAAQHLLQFGLGERRGRRQQLIGKIAPDGSADLRHILFLAAGPSRSRRPSSEACKVAGTASEDGGTADIRHGAATGAGLDHRLGQLLDKERHPVGALDDLIDNIRRQCPEIAGEPMHEPRPFVAAEPVQRDQRASATHSLL
jgi:hypothetical protein